MQVGSPFGVRRRGAYAEHAAEPAANVEADDQHAADVETGQVRGVVHLRERSFGGVLDLEDSQMLETRLDPGEVGKLATEQDIGIARRKRRAAGVHALE